MKKFFAILLSALMVLSMVACTAQGAAAVESAAEVVASVAESEVVSAASEVESAVESSIAEKAPVTLQVSIVETDFQDMWDDTIKPKFEAEYPWITLEDVGTGEDKGSFHKTRAAANDLPPVMQTDNGDTYWDFVDAGLLEDLKDTIAFTNIPKSYTDAYTHNDVCYGLTQGAAYDAIFYNMTILKDCGWEEAPKTFDDLVKCMEDVKAKGYDVFCFAGAKTTTCWMPLESIAATVIGNKEGEGAYEKMFRGGTIDFNAYPEIAERWGKIVPFAMTGVTTMTEDDVTATMTDGHCAMAVAGNWTSNNILTGVGEGNGVMAVFPAANAGETLYLSASPESSFGMSKVADENLKEARDIFFEWIFTPENFRYIQNARGTLPVLNGLTDDMIVLSDAAKAFVAETQTSTPFSMSFNNTFGESNKNCCTAMRDVYSGALDVAGCLTKMSEAIAAEPKNPQ